MTASSFYDLDVRAADRLGRRAGVLLTVNRPARVPEELLHAACSALLSNAAPESCLDVVVRSPVADVRDRELFANLRFADKAEIDAAIATYLGRHGYDATPFGAFCALTTARYVLLRNGSTPAVLTAQDIIFWRHHLHHDDRHVLDDLSGLYRTWIDCRAQRRSIDATIARLGDAWLGTHPSVPMVDFN
ncbi:hypothetical protein CLV47_11460 [Antricoccus suffuscus]|uniref:Uncharacterized protein n=1 Tax=Antricoccus suffuscus TaxID=1629062 RepID=A0A2T0ZWQ4_9ACTN|nr:hypothetical protein [Antricoccus suffuscus]PRZ40763.1 hypothetical protein CLV47_11460 [Antricoccus suffuscus]